MPAGRAKPRSFAGSTRLTGVPAHRHSPRLFRRYATDISSAQEEACPQDWVSRAQSHPPWPQGAAEPPPQGTEAPDGRLNPPGPPPPGRRIFRPCESAPGSDCADRRISRPSAGKAAANSGRLSFFPCVTGRPTLVLISRVSPWLLHAVSAMPSCATASSVVCARSFAPTRRSSPTTWMLSSRSKPEEPRSRTPILSSSFLPPRAAAVSALGRRRSPPPRSRPRPFPRRREPAGDPARVFLAATTGLGRPGAHPPLPDPAVPAPARNFRSCRGVSLFAHVLGIRPPSDSRTWARARWRPRHSAHPEVSSLASRRDRSRTAAARTNGGA